MIYVIGAQGFIGSAVVRACTAQGRDFAAIDLDNYDRYRGTPCDVLINVNGNSKKFLAREKPLVDFQASVASVRASLVDFPCESYVLLSSCDVYPDSTRVETTSEDAPIEPNRQSPYGFHKHLAEQCVRHAASRWLIFRGGGFVGPGLRKNPVYDILFGERLWMTAESELQYLHTDRAAEIMLELVDRGVRGEVLNLSARGVVGLEEVMQMAGRNVPVEPGSPRVRCEIDLAKLSSYVEVPETRDCVRAFIEQQRSRRVTGEAAQP